MDLLDLDRRACELNIKLLKEMTQADLSMATPCAEWNVRELVQHQVDTTANFTSEVRGTTITGAPVVNDPLGVYTAAVQEAWNAFDTAGMLDAEWNFPGFGKQSGQTIVAAHYLDNLIHAWDLAKAVGQHLTFTDDMATAATRIASHYPEGISAFAPPVPAGENATTTDRLVASLGRSPKWPA